MTNVSRSSKPSRSESILTPGESYQLRFVSARRKDFVRIFLPRGSLFCKVTIAKAATVECISSVSNDSVI